MLVTEEVTRKCASGSVGGARPCQGRGRGFESRLALLFCTEIGIRLDAYFLCKKSPAGLKQHSMNAVRGLTCVYFYFTCENEKSFVYCT